MYLKSGKYKCPLCAKPFIDVLEPVSGQAWLQQCVLLILLVGVLYRIVASPFLRSWCFSIATFIIAVFQSMVDIII